MNPAARVAGVDAGGSRTRAIITDTGLRILGEAEGPAGAVRPHETERAADAIMATIHDAVGRAGASALDACVVGAAGAGHPAVQSALADALRARGAPTATRVTTDADGAFASAFPEGPGILVLSGTGSIALARDAAGARHRVGGRGWRIGDEGSGYALGRAGLSAVSRALDGRGPDTELVRALPTAAGVASAAALLVWVGGAEPRAIAALGATVQQTAEAGDAVAHGLLDAAADDLAAHVVALRGRFPGERDVPVVLAGGALVTGRPLRRRVVTLLGARAPWVSVREVAVDGALGAATMALRDG